MPETTTIDIAALRFGAFVLDGAARELRRDGASLVVPRRVYDCIEYLVANRQRAVGRDELVEHVWGRANVSDVQLGQIVVQARRLLGDDGRAQACVRTVPGYGYRWVAPVEPVDAQAESVPATTVPALFVPAIAQPEPVPATLPLDDIGDAPASGDASPRALHWTSVVTAVVAVLLALLVMVAARYVPPPRELPAGANPVLVTPIEIGGDVGADNRWMRLGLMDLIGERLRAAGVAVVPNESALALLRGMSADADLVALKRRARVGMVVRARAESGPDGWRLSAEGLAADDTRFEFAATDRDAVRAAQHLAHRLLDDFGRDHGGVDARESQARQVLQRAQAAILGNDLDAARDILATAPQLASLEPQRRYRLAEIDFRAGRLAEADTALTALLADADAAFRPTVLNLRGAVRVRNEQYALARVDFQAVIDAAGDATDPVDLGKALMGRGITILFSEAPERTAGVADLGRARTLFDNAGDRLAVARVDANLGAAEVLHGRHANALAHYAAAAQRFEELGAVNESITNLSNMIDCQRKLLRWHDALATSERARALLPRVVDPKWRLDLAQRHIEALLGVGRLGDALALLPELDLPVEPRHAFLASRGRELRAELAWELGDVAAALDFARAALAQRPAHDFWHDEELALGIYVRAAIARGLRDDADPIVAALAARVRDPAADIEPRLRIAYAEWAYALGRRNEALEQLRIAQAHAEARGVPIDVVAVAASLGPMLLREGRVDESAAVIGRVAVWADHDFTSAVLQARLVRQHAGADRGDAALERVRALAGERRIPAELVARSLTRAE
ncbi:winged helix-turn-helix domain-containing protein [Tahibacter soli]|uniref:Winged helix-turn-helix domain-containing protein n=1 Tax=Tahibacter soli TaxID=2983605 RepID=A0A9X3YMF4_9GAMM|nr:winged helix-turn-helix domain-containing protein [Tahibacter soli]MDC8013426.1 winged helix-turn-helix domain-containing protein [Tahibacter soli]